MRVLIVEDNQQLAFILGGELANRGFSCDSVDSLTAGEEALAATSFDAIILDLGLPDGDGVRWLSSIRRKGILIPTLIMTGRDGLGDKIAGLNAGADDYLVKPADVDEITARLRALLRRPGLRSKPILEFGNLKLDTTTPEIHCAGERINLSRREIAFLQILMQRSGRVVSKAMIDNALYNFDNVATPNAIEMIASRLRKKLDGLESGCELHTVRGVGYLLQSTP